LLDFIVEYSYTYAICDKAPLAVKFLLLLLLSLLAQCAAAQETTIIRLPGPGMAQRPAGYCAHWNPGRPRLALALSGGGARGFAHIGVIKALEEAGIPVDGISGTSIGAVIGGLYAAGYSVQDLQDLAGSLDWGDIFLNAPARKSLPLSSKPSGSDALLELQFSGVRPHLPPALSAGQRLSDLLVDKVNRALYRGDSGFDQLKIPFRAVSVDVRTGDRVLFDRGDLSEALLASMALPLLIAPLEHDGQLLIDGGVAENIPVPSARELGDVVIAVDVTMPPQLGSPPYEPWVMANQVTGLMQQERNLNLLAQADLVLQPVPDTLGTFSFSDAGRFIELGYQSAKSEIEAIKQLLENRPEAADSAIIATKIIVYRCLPEDSSTTEISKQLFSGSPWASRSDSTIEISRTDMLRELERLQSHPQVSDCRAEWRGEELSFFVRLNPVLRSIRLQGVTQMNPGLLLAELQADTGKIIDSRQSAERLEDILRAYREHGNPLAGIESVNLDSNGQMTIQIDEGAIQNLRIDGNKKIGRRRILRDFSLKVGAALDRRAMTDGIAELYGSGLFNSVRATCVGGVVNIKVVESPLPRLRLGAGLDSERHGRGFAEGSYAALPLIGGDLTGLIRYGELDEIYRISYRNLAIFQTYLEGSSSLESSHTEYHYFDSKGDDQGRYSFDRVGAALHIGQQFRTWGRVVLGVRADRVRTDYAGVSSEWDLRRVFLRSEIDTQDRAEFPTSGRRYEFLMESAAPALQGEVSFNRIRLSFRDIQSITHRLVLSATLDGGICDQATPFSEWFRLGGELSFPGLHEAEKAGRQMINLGIELREDLVSRFLADAYLSLHGHVGTIWEDLDADINRDDFMSSLGLSFSLDTVLGPISVTYGHVFSGSQTDARDLFYFNLGHRF